MSWSPYWHSCFRIIGWSLWNKQSVATLLTLITGTLFLIGLCAVHLTFNKEITSSGLQLFFFFTVLEIRNMDIYCSWTTKNFKEAICQSWLINDLILLQVYCQHRAVLALQDVWCGSCLPAWVSGAQLSIRKCAWMADFICLPKSNFLIIQ